MKNATIIIGLISLLAVLFALELLPVSVYGPLLGALIAILGVEWKAQSDRTESRDSRRAIMKKEALLELAEGIDASARYVRDSAITFLHDEKISEPSGAWMTKIELVGQPPTVAAVGEVKKSLSRSQMKLLLLRETMRKKASAREDLRHRRSTVWDMQRSAFQRSRALGDERDPLAKAALARQIDDEMNLFDRQEQALDAEIESADRDLFSEFQRLSRTMFDCMADIQEKLAELQFAVRNEIGTEIEWSEYHPLVGSLPETKETVEELLRELARLWDLEPRASEEGTSGQVPATLAPAAAEASPSGTANGA